MRIPGLLIALTLAVPAGAWDAHGHRLITYLALDGLSADVGWLREPAARHRVAFQSSEADRWRGLRSEVLGHVNSPDHYLDAELMEEFGLTLETLPRLRNEYLRAMIISKHEHPERVSPYDVAKDPDRSKEWPGFALHAIAERYAKLRSALRQVRILEQLDDPARAPQLVQSRENAIYHMGMLSHFVGDLAQPLHTTRHFNGWVGENPEGYTTDRRFHAYIDGGALTHHGLTYATIKPLVRYTIEVDAKDPWDDVLTYFRRSFALVEPLYRLERDAQLKQQPGKELISERLADASAMLAALYNAAWASSVPTEKDVADFIYYDGYNPDDLPDPPGGARQPSAPAAGESR